MAPRPKAKPYTPDQERLDRYALFYQSLSPEEQKKLDAQVRLIQNRLGGYQKFGPRMAQEFIIALVDFYHDKAVPQRVQA